MSDKTFDPHRLRRYREHMAEIQTATSVNDSTRMAIAGAYKQAADDGFLTQAMKLVRKLLRMEPTARRAFWDEVELGLEATNCFAQEELPVGPDDANDAAGEHAAEGEGDAEPSEELALAEGEATVGRAERVEKPDDDQIRDLKEIGRRAGLAGNGPDKNPCDKGSVDAQLWETGRLTGEQELVDRNAAANQANRRTPRRGRVFEGSASVN